MQLARFLKVPVTFFYEEYKGYNDLTSEDVISDDLNYSFLTKIFANLSQDDKNKILQVLRNVENVKKTG